MNPKKHAFVFPLLLALFLGAAHADSTPPDPMVRNTADAVLQILRSDPDIEHGDMNKLGKLVEDKIASKFDFDHMSRMMLGQTWTTATNEQQDKFRTEFRSLLVRTYTSAISKYRNQTIEYKPLNATPGDTSVKVRTQIIQPGGPTIPLDYSLEKIENVWKVYDVNIDGLSLITTYRGQFSGEIVKNGLDGLIQKLSDKNRPAT